MTKQFSKLLAMTVILAASSTTGAAELKDYAGEWTTTVPKSVTNKPTDLDLSVKFDASGKGVPKFVTPGGDVVFFIGAVSADIFTDGGKDKVVLLREWVITLGKDKKTMTWTQVKGDTKLEFIKK